MANNSFRYHYLPLENVVVGESAYSAAVDLAKSYGAKHALIIASNNLRERTEVISSLANALSHMMKVTIYSAVRAHAPRADVLKAIQIAKTQQIDLIICVGGGSIIDAGKMVQLALNAGLDSAEALRAYAQYADGTRGLKAGTLKQQPDGVRQIAIPTTLSGAEFSSTASILDEASGAKEGYRSADLCPRAVIYDPQITIHTPEWLWLSTGMRAVDHAVEGYCADDVHPYLEGQFLHGLTLLSRSLPITKSMPSDVAARSLSQQATWMACAGLGRVKHGASHGIGYALSAVAQVPHGHTSCVLLPAVLAWNSVVNGERQRAIAQALGSEIESAAIGVKNLVRSLDLPVTLREVGVPLELLPNIAKKAVEHSVTRANPRKICSTQDVMDILELAW